MKLTEYQLSLIFEKNPDLKKIIKESMPTGFDAYLIFRENHGEKRPVISFRSEG